MSQITLKQLRYFVTASELKSITNAAQKLHVTQPSISAAVSHIEEVAGVSLFTRHRAQGISLTHAGEELLTRAKSLLRNSDALMEYTQTLSSTISGPLHIAAFETFAHVLAPGVIKSFTNHYPEISLHFDEQHQGGIVDGLRNGQYDIAFGYGLSVPSNFEFIELASYSAYAAVATDHPLANIEEISLEMLSEHPMILLDWPTNRDYFLGLFGDLGITPKVAHKVSSISMARELVAQGLGFSIFNIPLEKYSSKETQQLVSVPITNKIAPLKIGILYLKDSLLTPAAIAMRDFALENSFTRFMIDIE